MEVEGHTINSFWQEASKKYSQSVCVQIKKDDTYIKFTYSDIEDNSLKIASFLINQGIKPQEKIALILENSPEWICIYLGILKAAAQVVPLDPQLKPEELNIILNDCSPSLIFTSQKIFSPAKEILKAKRILLVDSLDFSRILEISVPASKLPQNLPHDIASLIYTSGTTAHPKGVCLTHKNLLSNFKSVSSLGIVNSQDNLLALLPFYHSYAFMATVLTPLFTGAGITIPSSLKSEDILRTIKETGVTIFLLVPQILIQIHKSIWEKLNKKPLVVRWLIKILMSLSWFIRRSTRINLGKILFKELHQRLGPKLRFIVSGGARLEPKITKDFLGFGFTVLEGYGLTETSPVVSFNPPTKIKPGSVGNALSGVEIKIVDPKDSNIELAQGKIGEVAIRGENVMLGYFNNPELTHQVIKNGWFLSGDLGYLDKEGSLFLTGRKKEIIVLASGKNIEPEELETYYSNTPYIKELCIIEKGGSLSAVVVPNLDYFKQTGEINIEMKIHWVLENLSQNLASYKRIMGFTLSKEPLKRTHLGKIKRYEVKQHYVKNTSKEEPKVISSEDLQLLEKEPAKSIMKYLQYELKKKIYLDDHLELDLRLDSISRVELALGLEKILKIHIPEELMGSIFTVRELILEISKIVQEKIPQENLSLSWADRIKTVQDKAILKKIRLEPDSYDIFLNLIFKNFFNILFRIFWLLRVRGRNNLPKDTPFILCPNHASFLDPFFIYSSLNLKQAMQVYFVGYSIFFEYWISSWIVKPFRIIPIDPAGNLTLSMQTAAYILRNKKSLCIFPEGMRAINENINAFKKGVGILALELNITLLPVYIKGSHQSWPRGKNLPQFHPVKIIFGRPKSPQELLRIGKVKGITDDYEALSLALREEVLKLAV